MEVMTEVAARVESSATARGATEWAATRVVSTAAATVPVAREAARTTAMVTATEARRGWQRRRRRGWRLRAGGDERGVDGGGDGDGGERGREGGGSS